ncbi:MAG: dicarboxylate/amino acid:cation symporter [Pirellulales bacterium]|nr:dicarboxylate/amino acid:cation symporter [Pirellulales bacterium]
MRGSLPHSQRLETVSAAPTMLEKPHLLENAQTPSRGLLTRYRAVPLYLRILIAFVLGAVLGLLLGQTAEPLKWGSQIVLRFLGALAPALILVAVMDSILNANIQSRSAARLAFLLLLNTLVAILIGLVVVNLVRPGEREHPSVASATKLAGGTGAGPAANTERKQPTAGELGEQLIGNIPKSVLEPLVTNNVIGVVFLAVAFGVAFRKLSTSHDLAIINQFISLSFKAIVVVLHWVIDLVPLAVFCTVAATVGEQGFSPLLDLMWFVVAVLIALAGQVAWYLARIHFGCWARPWDVVRGVRDALVMAFSTASSTATMPVTYACLRDKVGLREDSASMGALVGSNFNNDGTALYEAVAALFVAQVYSIELSLWHQLVVVVMAIVASIGAAGIPEAGLVTMTLVFKAVGLPLEYIPLLIPVDWFLDRCRTAINVLGDVNVSCMFEGKIRSAPAAEAATAAVPQDAPTP